MKKINCKHGLGPMDEIKARRLRQNIEDGNYALLKERVTALHKEYSQNLGRSFYDYIREKDPVLYSAFERAGGIADLYDCLASYGLV